jgi:opacity protein-like surface antigen
MYKKAISLMVLTAALACLLLPPGLFADEVIHIRILVTQARIRQAAALTAPVIAGADKGQVFDVIEKTGEWYAVQLPDGAKGYLHQSVVEEVAEWVAPAVPPPAQVPAVTERPKTRAATIARQSAPKRDPFSMFLGRIGFFLASDSAFKDIYGNGAVFGGELRLGRKRIVGWLEGSFRQRTGKFSFTGEETKVKVIGIEAGALYRIMPGNISPYAGAGIGYYMFNENNEPLGAAKQSKIGFCGAAGVSMIVAGSFVLDARVKFSTCAMKPADFDINVGGITLGIGAGFRF